MEFAIRTWALTDPALGAMLAEVDETRIQALDALFQRFGFGVTEARIRAQTVYLTQIGYISMRTEESLVPRLARIPDYVLVFSGVAPSAAELAAFRARHTV
jgi:hypothetical protein